MKKWINCAKFVAIIAVLVDHTNGILYTNQSIAYASYFSVTLFIFLSGMTSYYSDRKHTETWGQNIWRNCSKILLAYIVAVFIYFVVINHHFDLAQFLSRLVEFNISTPFYFVLLYLQLMLVNRPLFVFTNSKKGFIHEMLCVICLGVLAYFSINYTYILDVYGGGGKLLGGTYVVVYYLGMLSAKYEIDKLVKRKVRLIGLAIGLIGGTIWWRFICMNQFTIDSKIPFGRGLNPPSIS